MIKIILDRCCGCGLCIQACTYKAIEIIDKSAVVNEQCCNCGICIGVCKFNAIENNHNNTKELKKTFEYSSGVMIFAEQRYGKLNNVVFELLGEGKKLSDKLGVELSAVILGSNTENAANELIAYGAEKVYMAEHLALDNYNDELYANIFYEIICKYKPEIVLVGATTYGRSIAPRVSSRLNTGLTADCIQLDLDLDQRLLLQTRPAFGGNLMATIICSQSRPQMATIRPNVMKAIKPDFSRHGQIIKYPVILSDNLQTRIIEVINNHVSGRDLANADIIVSVGRGIGKKENIKLIEELAEVLGAEVGASRAVVDSGWVPHEYQIGQTGKTVKPKIYFACGISGTVQHFVGMSKADIIVAINKDPEADIFKISNFGIVGDLQEIIPVLINEFKKKLDTTFLGSS